MIGKLKGKVDWIEESKLILDVNGVGYLIMAPASTINKLQLGDTASLLIETYVREELINLYGFSSAEEKHAFNILTTVSGVGPKVALGILSHLSFEQLTIAIIQKDKQAFKLVAGVGPKLAERIILELKSKIGNTNLPINTLNNQDSNIINDALSALTNLGINKNDAYDIIQQVIQDHPNISLNELIKYALQARR